MACVLDVLELRQTRRDRFLHEDEVMSTKGVASRQGRYVTDAMIYGIDELLEIRKLASCYRPQLNDQHTRLYTSR
jgi:hypothetical protein